MQLKNSTDEAVDYYFQENKWVDEIADDLQLVKVRLNVLREDMGDFIDYEIFDEYGTSNSLKELLIIAKFERQPLIFTLTYYKPQNQWRGQNLLFSSEFSGSLLKLNDD